MGDRIGGDSPALGNSTGAVIDSYGLPLISTDMAGGQSYILGPTMLRAIVGGVANGDFAKPPPDPDAVLDTGDNALPYWDWVDTSSGKVTAQVVPDTDQASGNVLRFTAVGDGASSGTAYLQRTISVLGSRARSLTYEPHAFFTNVTGGTAQQSATTAFISVGYYDQAGSAVGTAASGGWSGAYITANQLELSKVANGNGAVSSDAAFLQLQIGVSFGTALNGTCTLDLAEMRLDTGGIQTIITDELAPETYGPGVTYLFDGRYWIESNRFGAGLNPTILLDAQVGDISLDASNSNGTAVGGNIFLNTKTGGTATVSDYLKTTTRSLTGDRTSVSTGDPTTPGVIADGSTGYIWSQRDNVTGNTQASGYFCSSYYNGDLQMIRFLRRITSGGASLTSTGAIEVANNATNAPAFVAGSDHRLKDNVRDAADELDFAAIVGALRPVLYREKAVDRDGMLGFIAHEVAAVIPEAVAGEKDAVDENGDPLYQTLAQARFIPYLVGAIKALTERIEALEAAASRP